MLQNFTWQIVNSKHLSTLHIVDVSSGQNSFAFVFQKKNRMMNGNGTGGADGDENVSVL